MQSDPYELSTVEVRRSEIEGAEEGLFATRDIILGKEARAGNRTTIHLIFSYPRHLNLFLFSKCQRNRVFVTISNILIHLGNLMV